MRPPSQRTAGSSVVQLDFSAILRWRRIPRNPRRGDGGAPTESALAHLSNLRLGVHLGLVNDTTVQVLNELGVQVQRGHIQAISQKSPEPDLLEASERDRLRAGLLRKRLA